MIVILTSPAFVAAELVKLILWSDVPISSQASAPPAVVVGYCLPAVVPIVWAFTRAVAAPPTKPTLILVEVFAAVIISKIQSISYIEPIDPPAEPENNTGRTLHRTNIINTEFSWKC